MAAGRGSNIRLGLLGSTPLWPPSPEHPFLPPRGSARSRGRGPRSKGPTTPVLLLQIRRAGKHCVGLPSYSFIDTLCRRCCTVAAVGVDARIRSSVGECAALVRCVVLRPGRYSHPIC